MAEPDPTQPAPGSASPLARRSLLRGIGLVSLTLLLPLAFLLLAGRHAPWREDLAGLWRVAQPGQLALALGLMSIGAWLPGVRWRLLLPPAHRAPSLVHAALFQLAALVNYVAPAPGGEVAVSAILRRGWGVPVGLALPAAFQARLLGIPSAGLLALATWASWALPVAPAHRLPLLVGTALGVLVSTAFLLLLGLPGPMRRGLARVEQGARHPLPRRLARGAGRVCEGLDDGAALGTRARRSGAGLLLSFAAHVATALGIHQGGLAMGLHPDPAGVAFAFATTNVLGLALLVLPGAPVAWDALLATLLVAAAGVAPPGAALLLVFTRLHFVLVLAGAVAAAPWLVRRDSIAASGP